MDILFGDQLVQHALNPELGTAKLAHGDQHIEATELESDKNFVV